MERGPGGYGAAFADVYDDWYDDPVETEAAVDLLVALSDGGPVLDVGAGTGRLTLPLARRGLEVVAVDAAEAMLARLRSKAGDALVRTVVGDAGDLRRLRDPAVRGPFRLAVVSRNTMFNLLAVSSGPACFGGLASVLGPGGALVVDADIPEVDAPGRGSTVHRRRGAEVVVRWEHDAGARRVRGRFVDGRGRVRPWELRYATPPELDAWAVATGLVLESRRPGWDEDAGPVRSRHVSVYRRRVTPPPDAGGTVRT